MVRKWGAAAVALTAALAAAVAGQSPAAAYEFSSVPAASWSYTSSAEQGRSFTPADYAPVGRQEPADGTKFRARLYFTIDLTAFDGKVFHEALLFTRERTAADCAAPSPLEVWRTAAATSAPTWKNPPAQLERLGSPAPAENYACPGYLQLDVLDAVKAAQSRGDDTLSLELRVAEGSEGAQRFGRTFHRPSLQFRVNARPGISSLQLQLQQACGTLAEPVLVPRQNLTLTAVTTGGEPNELVTAQFAHWPVDRPEQRAEVPGVGYSGDSVRYELTAGTHPHGTVVAWSARSWDGHDHSDWAQPCYFAIDSAAPAQAPVVTSAEYPAGRDWPGHGGVGVPGTFTLDAQGDPDVTRYKVWVSSGFPWYVDAPQPGAATSTVYTPTGRGPNTLYAAAVDKAGNVGPQTAYEFLVRDTAPGVEVEVAGVGLPSVLRLSPTIDGVTEYRYRIGDGAEATVAAAGDGSAVTDIVFPAVGTHQLTVSSYTAAGLAGVTKQNVSVTDAPRVTSSVSGPYGHQAVVGQTMTWTFKPGGPDVVAYQYRLSSDTELIRVEADATGTATLDWTPTEGGSWQPAVWAVYADGSRSATVQNLSVSVTDSRPYVESLIYNPWEPAGGVGVSSPFWIWSDLVDVPVTEFVVKLNDGAPFTLSTEGGTSTFVELAPDRAGENVLTVQARYTDGTLSPAREWTFLVAG
ncbi:hypothetical protein CS0771_14600 [Catellatospora sp. IY07-71]|uniref:hypothetical protein n=1 Tax=Catellatospora sp. IY07-71 TaxID=2728827 RepID=UPI001BB4019D|nr:hypothetical protein [Catellatospora sp. IY07-71]BCJ71916.1 hypothetical protein CS0771_14600 [Catellatospora sp. IY07-71]